VKTAIYVEDGVDQIVLTPETEFEKKALSAFTSKMMIIEMFEGSFYDCQGGWVRRDPRDSNNSLIIKASTVKEEE